MARNRDMPGVDLEPWVGARLIMRQSETDDATLDAQNKTGFGLSAGVNVRTGVAARVTGLPVPGVGAHVAFNISSVQSPSAHV